MGAVFTNGPRRGARPATAPVADADYRHDDGFTLVEMLVGLLVITVVMTALTGLYVRSMNMTGHLRAKSAATTLLTSSLDTARSVGAAGAARGRTPGDVAAQVAGFSGTPVASWLTSMNIVSDDTATNSSQAALPVTPETQDIGSTSYEINYVVGTCLRQYSYSDVSRDCTRAEDATVGLDYLTYTRVVVAVTWSEPGCADNRCYRISAVLLNGAEDPMFNDKVLPDPPTLTDCRDPDPVLLGLQTEVFVFGKAQANEEQPLCTLKDGLPPFTWTATALPVGLDFRDTNPSYIDGIAEGEPGELDTILTVTDVLGRSATGNEFTWTLVEPEPTIADIDDQRARIGDSFLLAVDAQCPLDDCTFTLGEPTEILQDTPAGPEEDDTEGGTADTDPPVSPISIDPTTGTLSGIAPGVTTVVRGLTVTITAGNGKYASTAPFDWTFTDGPVIGSIDDQESSPDADVSLDVPADCGPDRTCSFAVSGAPWLTIDGAGRLTGTTPSAGGTFTVTIADTAESDSATFTWAVTNR